MMPPIGSFTPVLVSSNLFNLFEPHPDHLGVSLTHATMEPVSDGFLERINANESGSLARAPA